MRQTTWLALALILLVSAALGCSHHGVPMGTVHVQLTDAPGVVDALHLTVVGVRAHRSETETESGDSTEVLLGEGWETLSSDTTSVDLMTLRNGVVTTLGVALVPSGHYTQIRLLLAPGSDVVIDGETHPLVTPSGFESGLKLIHPFDVPAGGEITLTLDFDAQKSVIETGAGTWMLKPTIAVKTD